jgi:hypothetical protein
MNVGAGVIAALALACAATSAAAQDDGDFMREIGVEARDLGLERMTDLLCGDVACEPATAAERASPPVSDDEAASIAAVAVISAAAEYCGLDWENESYRPLMVRFRNAPGSTMRKMALIGWTHGFVQGQAMDAFGVQGECDEQSRAAVQSLLDEARD